MTGTRTSIAPEPTALSVDTDRTGEDLTVATSLTAGGWSLNHAEDTAEDGLAVETGLIAGPDFTILLGGSTESRGTGASLSVRLNHAEGTTDDDDLSVETGLTAGPGSGGVWLNHAEDIVDDENLAVETGVRAGGIQFNHAEDTADDDA